MSTLEARPSFQRQASVEELVEMGRAIHARAAAGGGPAGDTPANRDTLRELIEDYPDFHQTFPIVMVYAVVQRLYRPEVFKEYLERLHCHNCRNNSEFLDNQSAYVGLLLRAENPRQSLKNLTSRTRRLLEAHDKRFKKAGEQAKEAAAMYAARGAEQARAVLLRWAQSAGTSGAESAAASAAASAATSAAASAATSAAASAATSAAASAATSAAASATDGAGATSAAYISADAGPAPSKDLVSTLSAAQMLFAGYDTVHSP